MCGDDGEMVFGILLDSFFLLRLFRKTVECWCVGARIVPATVSNMDSFGLADTRRKTIKNITLRLLALALFHCTLDRRDCVTHTHTNASTTEKGRKKNHFSFCAQPKSQGNESYVRRHCVRISLKIQFSLNTKFVCVVVTS